MIFGPSARYRRALAWASSMSRFLHW
jgi:hypothetical protein